MEALRTYCKNWQPADYILTLLIVMFPVYNKLMPMLMVLLGITLFFRRNNLESIKSLFSYKLPFIWFVVFYAVHIIGIGYTINMDYAISDIGMKASFIALPIILVGVRTSISLDKIIDLLIAGLILACAVFYSYAIFRSIYNSEDNHWAYFTESYFSFSMHRSYFATYTAIGVVLALYRLFKTKSVGYLFVLIVLSAAVVQSFSKAGILILAITFIPSLIYFSKKYYGWHRATILVSVSVLFIIVAFASSPSLRVRFQKMIEATTSVPTSNNVTVESSASRMIMWTTSLELFKENLLIGVGTGDVSDALDQRNVELGNLGVAESSLNSHNQYLNTSVQLGLLGLIPLILIFVTTFFYGWRNRSFPVIVITFVLATTLLFESFLETQAGIIPVTLLLLIVTLKLEEEKFAS